MTSETTPAIFPTVADAKKVADALTAAETKGWTYTVKPLPNGRALIQISDEDGEFVAFL
jgi:hypothetical protein